MQQHYFDQFVPCPCFSDPTPETTGTKIIIFIEGINILPCVNNENNERKSIHTILRELHPEQFFATSMSMSVTE